MGKKKYANGENLDYVFFWGHQPRGTFKIGKACLSQWFFRTFEYNELKFPTAEHWMMAEKAKMFGDEASFKKIVQSTSPKDAKAIGRKVKGFDDSVWSARKNSIVKNGNYLKFKQHKDLWNYLDGTGDKILVEASPYDKIWGIGMKYGDEGIENPNKWKGVNLLGYALMEVRDLLRAE